MKHPERTEVDSRTCKQIWAEYQKQHDITDRIGQTAGELNEEWILEHIDEALDIGT